MALLGAFSLKVQAQYDQTDSTYRRWFVGTSLFVFLGNLDRENPPNFVHWTLAIASREKTSFVYRQKLGNMLGQMAFTLFWTMPTKNRKKNFLVMCASLVLPLRTNGFYGKDCMPNWMWCQPGNYLWMKITPRLTMVFSYLIRIAWAITSNFLMTDFSFNHQFVWPIVPFTPNCPMDLNSWTINGRNLFFQNQV